MPECRKIKNGGLDQYGDERFGRLIFTQSEKCGTRRVNILCLIAQMHGAWSRIKRTIVIIIIIIIMYGYLEPMLLEAQPARINGVTVTRRIAITKAVVTREIK